jgi:hypothetical protein
MIWFRKSDGMSSESMRKMAADAGVDWNSRPIVYRGVAIGYKHGDTADVTAIQNAAEELLGYRPVQIDAPPEPDPP